MIEKAISDERVLATRDVMQTDGYHLAALSDGEAVMAPMRASCGSGSTTNGTHA